MAEEKKFSFTEGETSLIVDALQKDEDFILYIKAQRGAALYKIVSDIATILEKETPK